MFVYGTQYYRAPHPPQGEWGRDLELIKKYGFNTIKLFAMWTWLHEKPNKYNFSDTDRLMDLADKNSLKVVINITLEDAPYWLEEKYPDCRYVANDGTVIRLQGASERPCGGWPGLCLDNDKIRVFAEDFIQKIISRYKDHPALLGYDVWNEPHMEPTWHFRDKIFCYCKGSTKKFKEWLKNKYESIDNLNRVWSRKYSNWNQVFPPHNLGGYPDMIDWLRFRIENLGNLLSWRVQTVREVDTQHPIATHVAHSGYLGDLVSKIWDEWEFSDHVDIFGTSAFPLWLMKGDLATYCFHLDMIYSASKGKTFWLTELQGGHGQKPGLTRTALPSKEDIQIWNWCAFSSGAKGLLYWQWRPELFGPEAPGYGLCNIEGTPTERAKSAKKIAYFLQNNPVITEGKRVRSKVGILISRDIALFNYAAEGNMEYYAKALMGAYRAFFEKNMPVSFINSEELKRKGEIKEVQFLYFPFPIVIDEKLARALEGFIARGGTLVVEACLGHFQKNGDCAHRIPPFDLKKVFGVEETETEWIGLSGQQVKMQALDCVGALYLEHLSPVNEDVQILGRTQNGSIWVAFNRYKKGKTYFIGTYPSIGYECFKTQDNAELITMWAREIEEAITVETSNRGVRTNLHEIKDGYLLFVLNFLNNEQRLEVRVKGINFNIAVDLVESKQLEVTNENRLRLQIDKKAGTVIKLT